MHFTRRESLKGILLGSAAVVGGSFTLVGCVTNPTTGQLEINPAFVDGVISVLQSGCAVGLAFIPTVTSVADVVAALFGPAAVATVQLINGAVNQVASALCSAIPTPVPSSLRLRLRSSSVGNPVLIGVITVNNTRVVVNGYQTRE